ncbi:MAG: D-sedoheptulose 7-phosphate isomerase [Marinifilaceae bacterium]|jgi:D-sedoheptulose 7-phosphate isomerase|nr:D-sedoheptulose 7-phosphate isomerase [Marinilabiliaceae bacterium JC040]MCT4600721.1 D-sedoheptulose 7-phosphate isomerase [Marinifilaceae bacterium]
MSIVENSLNDAFNVLSSFIKNKKNIESIEAAGEKMVKSIKAGGKIIACGNGGSLCDATHFCEELTGRFRHDRKSIPAISINDPSHITCVGNDYGFDYIFSKYVEGHGNNGDILFAISTSGNSSNVINAVKEAKSKGMFVVSMTGKDGGILATLSDIDINVPWNKYSDRIQEIHIKVIHILVELIEKGLGMA